MNQRVIKICFCILFSVLLSSCQSEAKLTRAQPGSSPLPASNDVKFIVRLVPAVPAHSNIEGLLQKHLFTKRAQFASCWGDGREELIAAKARFQIGAQGKIQSWEWLETQLTTPLFVDCFTSKIKEIDFFKRLKAAGYKARLPLSGELQISKSPHTSPYGEGEVNRPEGANSGGPERVLQKSGR